MARTAWEKKKMHVCELKASFTFCIVLHGRNALIRLGDNYG